MSADFTARALALRARSQAIALPALMTARQPLTTNPLVLAMPGAPPAVTEADGETSSIAGAVSYSAGDPNLLRWTCIGGATALTGGLAGYFSGARSVSDLVIAEFLSDAAAVEFRLNSYATVFDITVDGQPVRAATFTTTAAGTGRLVKLDWSADADPTRPRHYQIAGINLALARVYTSAGGSLWLPDGHAPRKLLAVMGDSYTQGTGASQMRRHWAPLVSRLFGMDHWHDGTGGTGWNSTGTNDPVTRLEQRLGALNRKPDVVVFALGYNDFAGNMTALAERVTATLTTAKTLFPAARLIALGPWTPLGATPALSTVKAAMAQQAAAQGVAFVDIENLINTANKAQYTGPDNVHPNMAGHTYLAHRIARRLASIIT